MQIRVVKLRTKKFIRNSDERLVEGKLVSLGG